MIIRNADTDKALEVVAAMSGNYQRCSCGRLVEETAPGLRLVSCSWCGVDHRFSISSTTLTDSHGNWWKMQLSQFPPGW